jgi:hypothetical protein
MQNFIFKRLTIISDTQKSANQFTFQPKFNLITGNDNSIGKSTIAKMLLWSLGCDPELDTAWQALDVRATVEFTVGGAAWEAGRYGDSMFLRPNGETWTYYPKITGQYSSTFADLVGFQALLPTRKDPTQLETPPPAFYFLPFYIDQRRSWAQAWSSFLNLEQYSKWQPKIIRYHTGYLSPAFFEIEKEIAEHESIKKAAEADVRRVETAIEVIKEYLPAPEWTIALTKHEFDTLTFEVTNELSKLQETQEKLLHTAADIHSERQYLLSQLELAKVAASELEKDYMFSVECIESDTLQCPLCGTMHDNSLVSRASILADKSEALRQVELLTNKIAAHEKKIVKSQKELSQVREQIDTINKKYTPHDEAQSQQNSETSLIDALVSQTVQKHVQCTIESKSASIHKITKLQSHLKKEQKKLLTKEQIEDMDTAFRYRLANHVESLHATGVNIEPVKSPLDYKKLYASGGAAESTRGMLAYHMAVMWQIYRAKNEALAPIIIDTPNQQEQADFNYERIIEFLTKTIPTEAQFILCAMDRKEIINYKATAHVINLDEGKILTPKKYDYLRPQLAFFSSFPPTT